jgi:regulatory protein
MREHSTQELRAKLLRRGDCPETVVDAVLAELNGEGLLDERRFVEAFIRSRCNRGQGPLRIEADLRQRGVRPEVIADGLDAAEEDGLDWFELCRAARRKRFGPALPSDWGDKARQARFLRMRGFTEEQIRAAIADLTE